VNRGDKKIGEEKGRNRDRKEGRSKVRERNIHERSNEGN
jgi:hypothetical protein